MYTRKRERWVKKPFPEGILNRRRTHELEAFTKQLAFKFEVFLSPYTVVLLDSPDPQSSIFKFPGNDDAVAYYVVQVGIGQSCCPACHRGKSLSWYRSR
jgi:hypothetical protein